MPEGQIAGFPGNNAETRRRDLTPRHPHLTPRASQPRPSRGPRRDSAPAPALRRSGARLTQQRPQVLQAGQHVLLGVQHLLGGLLHIPVASSGEHSATGSLVPAGGTTGARAAQVTAQGRGRRVSRGPLTAPFPAAAVAASGVATGRRGGHCTTRGGAGRRCQRETDGPAPREAPAGPSGAAHVCAVSTPRRGTPGALSRRRESQRSLPRVYAVLQVPGCTAIEPFSQPGVTLAQWKSVGRL